MFFKILFHDLLLAEGELFKYFWHHDPGILNPQSCKTLATICERDHWVHRPQLQKTEHASRNNWYIFLLGWHAGGWVKLYIHQFGNMLCFHTRCRAVSTGLLEVPAMFAGVKENVGGFAPSHNPSCFGCRPHEFSIACSHCYHLEASADCNIPFLRCISLARRPCTYQAHVALPHVCLRGPWSHDSCTHVSANVSTRRHIPKAHSRCAEWWHSVSVEQPVAKDAPFASVTAPSGKDKPDATHNAVCTLLGQQLDSLRVHSGTQPHPLAQHPCYPQVR